MPFNLGPVEVAILLLILLAFGMFLRAILR
jgi:hypothetical protein